MAKFHEGQEVRICAKIDRCCGFGRYVVKFPDGTESYFREENIRAHKRYGPLTQIDKIFKI
jgi:hypothetical protein